MVPCKLAGFLLGLGTVAAAVRRSIAGRFSLAVRGHGTPCCSRLLRHHKLALFAGDARDMGRLHGLYSQLQSSNGLAQLRDHCGHGDGGIARW